MRKIVLASQSPRRRELLAGLGVEFTVLVDSSPEVDLPGEEPSEMVKRLSMEKVKNVAVRTEEPSLVVGADTVVVLDGNILGKPKDRQEAEEMLRSLSGREHTVYTGVAVLDMASGTGGRFCGSNKGTVSPIVGGGNYFLYPKRRTDGQSRWLWDSRQGCSSGCGN